MPGPPGPGHRRGRGGPAAAAEPGRGAGQGGDGPVRHGRGRGRGHRRRRPEVPGDGLRRRAAAGTRCRRPWPCSAGAGPRWSASAANSSSRGIPYEIVGLGGLLDTPEIVDLVATLRVLADPGRSDSLMRLLAGARWRIGPADLMAFRDWSSFLARRRGRPGSSDADDDADAGDTADDAVIEGDLTDAASLVEALDWLPREGWTSAHGRRLGPEAAGPAAAALGRAQAAAQLHGRRPHHPARRGGTRHAPGHRSGGPARDQHPPGPAEPGRLPGRGRRIPAHLPAGGRAGLPRLAGGCGGRGERPGSRRAGSEPRGRPAPDRPRLQGPGMGRRVRPGLNAGRLPQQPGLPLEQRQRPPCLGRCAGTGRTCRNGTSTSPTRKAGSTPRRTSSPPSRSHGEAEERRLAYVAYTRAKHVLWVSSAAWVGSRAGMAEMSPFLAELERLAAEGRRGNPSPVTWARKRCRRRAR